jgi:phosphatidate cytidylyltransferase
MGILSSNLFKRVAVALVFGPMVIALALWSKTWGWKSFIILANGLALYEYGNMAFKNDKTAQLEKLLMVFTGVIYSLLMIKYFATSPAIALLITPWIILTILVTLVFISGENIKIVSERIGKIFIGIFYVSLLFSFLALIKIFPHGGRWVIFTLTIVWFGDTGAYFVGKSLGKHKLAPVISPNKTWEGSVGGILASLLAGYLATLYITDLSIKIAFPIAIIAGAMGQIGDLAESMLKRSYGVKDSGSIIPGHGGILDRVDALLFAAPVVFALLLIKQM